MFLFCFVLTIHLAEDEFAGYTTGDLSSFRKYFHPFKDNKGLSQDWIKTCGGEGDTIGTVK